MFLVFGGDLATAGTGIVAAFVVGGVIALSMALCYAEMGSLFPSLGGAYTIVRQALGPAWGGLATILFLVLGITATASILVAAATYLESVVAIPVPVNWVAFVMMVVVTLLSLERIAPTGWVASLMVVLELAVILAFTGFALAHERLGAGLLVAPRLPALHGALAAVGLGALAAAVVPALFAYNSYDWPLYFAAETRREPRTLPYAVLAAAGISVVVELVAVIAATGAIPVHALGAMAASASPLSAIAARVMGPMGAKILLIGVVIAMFDTGLAGNLGYARIFWAASQDRMWPGPLNGLFGYLGATQVPVGGFLVLFVGNAILTIVSSLNNLITFTGVVLVTIYLLVAISAIVSRVRHRDHARPFAMPLWPLALVLAIGGVVVSLVEQSTSDLVIAGTSSAVVLIAYALRSARGRRAGGPDLDAQTTTP